MSFYMGSLLSIEWTNQHGCGNPKMHCNVVLQWMCSRNDQPAQTGANVNTFVRDGSTTDTINDDPNAPNQRNANGDFLFGMHEPYQFYQDCKTRDRNLGLFIADREDEGGLNPGRASSIFTRQNNNGNRHGYECPEERDYYPYWAPTPWKDIAILADDPSHCDFYQSNSQNAASRFVCVDKTTGLQASPNNEKDCRKADGTDFVEVKGFNIAKPACAKAPWNRMNHLGDGVELPGYQNSFNWTLPDGVAEPACVDGLCNCVLRLRYNISTADLGDNGNNPGKDFIDASKNAAASPVLDDQIVDGPGGNKLQLALDTTQFGRTFEDRSHVFHIIPRPAGVSAVARIFNLNVRGKRGNIVQTYPATEYDFTPELLFARPGDFVHFQWTGCDTNPAGNAGEGTDQTDRSNIVQIPDIAASQPCDDKYFNDGKPAMFDTPQMRLFMAYLGVDPTSCPTQAQLLLNNNNNENQAKQDPKNCFKLNAMPQYFNAGLVKMNNTGTFFYMNSRNNNFTNRGQKAILVVDNVLPIWGIVVVAVGGAVCVGASAVAGAMFYAKSHPHSGVAQMVSKF